MNVLVDHWTSKANSKGIIETGALYKNEILKDKEIKFDKNAIDNVDYINLDGKIICNASGGGIDVKAFANKNDLQDLLRLRIDLTKVKVTGDYNQFFKAVDLCVPHYLVEILITPKLRLTIKIIQTPWI